MTCPTSFLRQVFGAAPPPPSHLPAPRAVPCPGAVVRRRRPAAHVRLGCLRDLWPGGRHTWPDMWDAHHAVVCNDMIESPSRPAVQGRLQVHGATERLHCILVKWTAAHLPIILWSQDFVVPCILLQELLIFSAPKLRENTVRRLAVTWAQGTPTDRWVIVATLSLPPPVVVQGYIRRGSPD